MRYLLCAFMALALNGCASVNYAQKHADAGHYNYNPNDSMALNVARATGLTECDADGCAPLRDVPRSKLPASLQGKTNLELAGSVMDALTIGQGVGQIAGVASVVTGVGNVAGGLLTLGSLFTGPVEMHDPATIAWINAWMPKSMADSPAQARDRLMKLIHNGAPDGQFSGYRVIKEEYPNQAEDPAYQYYYNIGFTGGPGCAKPHVCNVMLYFHKPEVVAHQPSWVGQGLAYAWMNWSRGQKSNTDFSAIRVNYGGKGTEMYEGVPMPDGLNSRVYLLRMSANLPQWVYIYLPPDKFASYPVILNQGKILLFVEPKQAI